MQRSRSSLEAKNSYQELNSVSLKPQFSRTFTPAFDKKIAEDNKKLSQDILNILSKPLERNKNF